MTDPTTGTATREMQDATLNRMLIDSDHVRRLLAVAGVLETARTETIDAVFSGGGVTLMVSLAFVPTLFAHHRLYGSLQASVRASGGSAWHPSGASTRVDGDPMVTGAWLAV